MKNLFLISFISIICFGSFAKSHTKVVEFESVCVVTLDIYHYNPYTGERWVTQERVNLGLVDNIEQCRARARDYVAFRNFLLAL